MDLEFYFLRAAARIFGMGHRLSATQPFSHGCLNASDRPASLTKYLAILLLVCSLLVALSGNVSASQAKLPTIVILDSYHHGYEWSSQELDGLLSRLKELYPSIDPVIEHLDAKRNPNEENLKVFKSLLKEKYAGQKPDLVIVLDDPALNLLLNHRDELFRDTPIVFGGINNFNPKIMQGHKNVTGVAQIMDVPKTVETALDLHPETKKIFVLHDYTVTGLAMRQEAEEDFKGFSGRVLAVFSNPMTFEEAAQEMRSLPPHTIGLILSFVSDRHGKSASFSESVKALTLAASRPIYSTHFNALGNGIVGGSLVSGFDHGRVVADIALRILKGEEADSIPVVMSSGSKRMFDHVQLERFGVDMKSLPPDSIVINKPLSFYEEYKTLTIGTISAIIFLLAVICTLIASLLKLRKSLGDLYITRNSLGNSLRELETRNRLNTILLGFRDESMYNEVLDFLLEVTGSELGIFGYFNSDGDFVAPAVTRKVFNSQCNVPEKEIIFKFGDFTRWWARSIREKNTVIRNGGGFSVPQGHLPIENTIIAPIVFNDVVVSSINLANKPGGYSKEDAQLIEMLASQIAPVLYTRLERDRQDSDRRKAEAELERSEHFLEQIVENIPDMIFVKDVDSLRFVRFNKAGEDLLGYSRDDLLGKNDYDFFTEEQADFFTEKDRQVIAGKNVTEIDYEQINTKLKGTRILRTKKLPVVDAKGEPQFLLGISTDITEQKKAEDELKSAYIRLHQIFDSITGLILVIDSTTYEILYANKFSEEIYGKNLEGGLCYERLNGFDTVCDHCSMSKVIELQGQPHQREWFSPGLKKHLFVTERLIKWPDNRDVKFQFALDMTDIKQSEREKEKLQSQLLQAQKMEAVGTLAGGIAHDFNNLLQVVLGYSEIVLARKTEDEVDYQDVFKIQQAGKRGADLVKKLLTFSRRVESKFIPIDLNQQITSLGSLLSRTIPKNISIDLSLGGDLAPILADPTQVDQILMNLAVNARDAMPGGGTLTIQTANVTLDEKSCSQNLEAQPGDYVLIRVSDTGHGMDSETLEHIFEPFFSTKEVGKGTGLGLATIYGIVKHLRGHIQCESILEQGTTFMIYLPAAPKQEVQELPAQETLMPGRNETVLLVDDEDEIRNLAKTILERAGYKVLTARNGLEAVETYGLRKNEISVTLLDLIMPQMDGVQCLKEILAINPQAPVIIASGFSVDSHVKSMLEQKARGFVEKPYNSSQLNDCIRSVLDRKSCIP